MVLEGTFRCTTGPRQWPGAEEGGSSHTLLRPPRPWSWYLGVKSEDNGGGMGEGGGGGESEGGGGDEGDEVGGGSRIKYFGKSVSHVVVKKKE